MNYTAQFVSRQMVGSEIMLFSVEKPENFRFLAGQFCFITVPDMGFQDNRGLRRPFSIASSPLEKDLLFVVKMSYTALKRTMSAMSPGTAITVESPVGNLILPETSVLPLVFLAGGVGIAPFRSLILYAVGADTGHRITLIYSGQTPEETPFLEELRGTSQENPRISVIPTMTRLRESPSTWTGLTGRIGPQMIKNECEAWDNSIYYIVGPPPMAVTMQEILRNMNIPSSRIKMEAFA